MILNANDYRINKEVIRQMTIDKTEDERREFLGNLAIATGVPIIVVACYMGELYGFTDRLKATIMRLCEFYTVTDVLNTGPIFVVDALVKE